MSALRSEADVWAGLQLVCFVPVADTIVARMSEFGAPRIAVWALSSGR